MNSAFRSLATRYTPTVTLLFVIVFLIAAIPVFAQVQTGTPPFGSLGGGPDVINLANLNAHLNVPVLNKAGRGLPFTFFLTYDSSLWAPVVSSGSRSWKPAPGFGWNGTELKIGFVSTSDSSSSRVITCSNHLQGLITTTVISWTYTDGFGTAHRFPAASTTVQNLCTNSTTSTPGGGTANDGSGYTLSANGFTFNSLVAADGNLITAPVNTNTGAGSVQDRNGNQISVSSSGVFTDTLGTTALTIAGSGTTASPTTYTYTAPSGANAAYTVNYTNYTVASNFGISGISEYKSSAAVPLVSSIVQPDGSQYTFHYEATPSTPSSGACTPFSGTTCVTARLTSVTLPTGGNITYAYSGGNNGIFSDGSVATLTRTTPDGTWTYAQVKGAGAASTTTITDPQSNVTVISFQGIYETQRQVYQGSIAPTNLLRSWNTCYNGSAIPCTSTAVALPITTRTVIDQYGSTGVQCKHVYSYNSLGLLTEQDDFDYGSGGPGALLRKQLIAYASLGNNVNNAPQTITIQDGAGNIKAQTTIAYDQGTPASTSGTPQHNSVSGSRGNPTSVTKLVQGTASLQKTYTYFDTGLVQNATDVNGAATTFAYGTCGNSFPTSISEPLSLSKSFTWNCTGGVPTQVTDENSQVTTATWNDPNFWRPASIAFPDGGQTSWAYNSETSVTTTTKMNSSQNIVTTQLLDGLGRNKEQQVNSDPEGVVYQDAAYDTLGRLYTVSNPYRSTSDPTYGLTTYAYDALSRTATVTLQDGSVTSASYSNNTVTATDPAAKKRTSTFDSLGRLTQVTEDPFGLAYVTTYSYDALGDLTAVTQNGSRQRTYVYDALSRLTSETNPESGTITYGYDASGHTGDLTSKVAPAPNQTGSATLTTTYAYDLLHRLTSKTYSDGITPTAQFLYDVVTTWANPAATTSNMVGRLSKASVSTGQTLISASIYGYDATGRVTLNSQCTPYNCGTGNFPVTYSYDLAGNATSFTNGLSLTLSYTYDGAGRPTQVTGFNNPPQYPGTLVAVDSTNGYYPNGALRKTTLGNGLTTSNVFNNSLQPCRINTNSSGTLLQTCSDSTPTGNVLDFSLGFNSGTSNNGNVVSWNATGQQSFARTFAYDSLNRLSTMSDTASAQVCKGLSWTYDPWGNRTDQTVTGGSCVSFHQSVNAQNRLVGPPYLYDAAGNMTNDGSHTYTYNAENRLIQVDGTVGNCSTATACYLYDAEGRRVEKNTPSGYKDYVYDLTGNAAGEWLVVPGFTGPGAHYAYFGGQLVVEYENSTTYFVHQDHLGSIHLITGVDQSIKECNNFLPFGESDTDGCSSTTDQAGQTHKFTSDERDAETGQDHTEFRQYASSLGRWTTPDPAGLAAVNPANPQSWNRYSYVANAPTSFKDPLGLTRYSLQCPPANVGGGRCASAGAGSDCADFMCQDNGYDIFDAIAGAPGTYLSYNVYGQISFGFSEDLYQFIANSSSSVNGGLAVDGWTYIINDYGAEQVASGFLADKIASAQQAAWLNANYPGSVDQITININLALSDLANQGLNVAALSMPKIIGEVVYGYAQQEGLSDDWAAFFYNYFINLGPALPQNP